MRRENFRDTMVLAPDDGEEMGDIKILREGSWECSLFYRRCCRCCGKRVIKLL